MTIGYLLNLVQRAKQLGYTMDNVNMAMNIEEFDSAVRSREALGISPHAQSKEPEQKIYRAGYSG